VERGGRAHRRVPRADWPCSTATRLSSTSWTRCSTSTRSG
jgi:hypothetical protein